MTAMDLMLGMFAFMIGMAAHGYKEVMTLTDLLLETISDLL